MQTIRALGSEIRFHRREPRRLVPALAHARIAASSEGLGWSGMFLEVGTNYGCEVDELMVDGHYVGIQLNEEAIRILTRGVGDWKTLLMPSRSLWIHPEGTPFSVRHSLRSRWAGAVIDGRFLDSVLGHHHQLRAGYVVEDELLSHLLLALIGQLDAGAPQAAGDTALSASLIHSFVLALGKRHGIPAPPLPINGGIAPYQLKALLSWVQAHISSALTVEAMAARVGLSVAHFAREFKRSMGSTPWAYVLEQRLIMARDLLLQGTAPGTVAHQCGFADQSHLCRAVKTRFGLTPGAMLNRSDTLPDCSSTS
ncbi:MAG: hypothetical protein JWQ90_2576 [Hydrocarboniphaga sp.]|uniref:AraC family transcriptional regulator n=1 Tax=Hydrocarboniphaga sp. TaxID=2033016 RepID=UPI002620D985|nr:AraC family transcriptional regulator [Hydrocarboniphaga sp.]MDB5970126.1 hypothetical protein [Hydrocarboniphaga sp.]